MPSGFKPEYKMPATCPNEGCDWSAVDFRKHCDTTTKNCPWMVCGNSRCEATIDGTLGRWFAKSLSGKGMINGTIPAT